ncbi:hypothetical protein BJ742DRAFT_125273 [Cladochytrium replicatum]|nr:hypothetical protein BJ742DRAFT_125273 [Cladochytrium replicatum]
MTRRNDNSYRPSRRQSPGAQRASSAQEKPTKSTPSSQSTSMTVRLNQDGRDVSLRPSSTTTQNPQISKPNNSSESSSARQSQPSSSSLSESEPGGSTNNKPKPTVFSRLGKRNEAGNRKLTNEYPTARQLAPLEVTRPDRDKVDATRTSNSGSNERAGSKRERSAERKKPRESPTQSDRRDSRSRESDDRSRKVETHSKREMVEKNRSSRVSPPPSRSTQWNSSQTTDGIQPSRAQKCIEHTSTESRGVTHKSDVQRRGSREVVAERPQREKTVENRRSTEKYEPRNIVEGPNDINGVVIDSSLRIEEVRAADSPLTRSGSECAEPPSMSESRFADSREFGDVISLNGDDDVLDWDDDESMMDGADGSTNLPITDDDAGPARKNSMQRLPARRRDSGRSAAGARPRGEDRPKGNDAGNTAEKPFAGNRSQDRKRSRSTDRVGVRQLSQNRKRSRSADGSAHRQNGREDRSGNGVEDRMQGLKVSDRAAPVPTQGRNRPPPGYGPSRHREHSDGGEDHGRNADRDIGRNGYPSAPVQVNGPGSHVRARGLDRPPPPLPYPWTQTSRNGRVYFYNMETRESVWELPAPVQAVVGREYVAMREPRRGVVDVSMDRGPRKGDRDAWGRAYSGGPEPSGYFPPSSTGRPQYRQGEENVGGPLERISPPEWMDRDWPRINSRERTDYEGYEGFSHNTRVSGGSRLGRGNQGNQAASGRDSNLVGNLGVNGSHVVQDRAGKGANRIGSLFKKVWWGFRGCTLEVDDGPRVKRIKLGNGDDVGTEKRIIKGWLDHKGNVRVGRVVGKLQ